MFGDFHGLPVHALVLHVAVVFAPLAAVTGIAFVVPRWRSRLRWPFLVVAAIAVGAVFVSIQSGKALRTALGTQLTGPGNLSGALISQHEQFADRLMIALLVLFAAAILVAVLEGRSHQGWVGWTVASGVTVVALAVLVLTYQTGEAGAKARWNPDGSFDYSAGK